MVSWSLLDAMASGCSCSRDVEPVRGVAHPTATEWVDHRDASQLLKGLETGLSLLKLTEKSEDASSVAT